MMRFLLKLPFRILAIPILLITFLVELVGIFLTSMSEAFFNLVAFGMFASAAISMMFQTATCIQGSQMMIGAFVVFIIPQIAKGILACVGKVGILLSDFLWS